MSTPSDTGIALAAASSRKENLLGWCGRAGVFAFFRWLTRHDARILAYHGVDDRDEPLLNFDGFHVAPDVFDRHLRTLAGHYTVVTLGDLAACYARGVPPPPRAVAITFDDGYRNNLTHAAPLLERYGFKATFFVTTGFIDRTHRPWWFALREALAARFPDPAAFRREVVAAEASLKRMAASAREEELRRLGAGPAQTYPLLDWDDVKQLQRLGHEIGAHTVSHISMGHEPAAVIAEEIHTSLARIRAMTGVSPVLFSYPYGERDHHGAEAARLVRAAGCIGGVTAVEGLNGRAADPFLLRRLNVTGGHGRQAFRALVSGFTLAVRR